MIDNLPDWDLSACNIYRLDGYVARDVDSIQISVVGEDGLILFDSESRELRYLGDPKHFYQAVIDVHVVKEEITETSLFFAYYTSAEQDLKVSENVATGRSGASQYVGDKN